MTEFKSSNFGKSIFGFAILGLPFLASGFWFLKFRHRIFGSKYSATGFRPALMGLMHRTASTVDRSKVHDTYTQESADLVDMFAFLRAGAVQQVPTVSNMYHGTKPSMYDKRALWYDIEGNPL